VPVPDLADPRAPYLQIADDLRRQIETGRYQPGDRLPSLPTMQDTYGCAAATVRHALRELRDEGLVATQSTRGTFVLRQEREASGEVTQAELRETEARLTQHVDEEIAKLREELEFTQAQVLALGGQAVRESPAGE
jgi:DNA-binding GntR family transcriptional regulator